MTSQGRDRLILREDIISDEKVSSRRDPNTVLRNHRKLTREDKLALFQHAQEYAWVLVHQRGQASANSKKLLKNPYPSYISRLSTEAPVGFLKKTCSNEAANNATLKCDEPIYLGLFVNENAESMEWTWHNGKGLALDSDRIEFEPGFTVTQAKINAIHNYDNHERKRISSYNIQRIVCATRRILVKWAVHGSESLLKIDPEDMASKIQPLVLASDLARSMVTAYSRIFEGMNGESDVGTDDPDSD
ncbi:hypothetical protein FAGAP_1074 [Fusarium agapanthi]|uniref:Uncharacterized protein n=1 Tax=Fusarium agapanthi TaxID=1803897 RepID=A0A9P5BLS7_9HYPO|nr:hypothetical protein FAGAP_1074 [Fusarium agapanthi]